MAEGAIAEPAPKTYGGYKVFCHFLVNVIKRTKNDNGLVSAEDANIITDYYENAPDDIIMDQYSRRKHVYIRDSVEREINEMILALLLTTINTRPSLQNLKFEIIRRQQLERLGNGCCVLM
jgi:hypothetical protein